MGFEYKIIEFRKDNFNIWNNFVKKTSLGSIFNSTFWLNAVSSITAMDYKIIGCYRGDELVGGCALNITEGLEGITVKFPPFTQYSGVLLSERDSKYLNKDGTRSIEIISSIIGYLERNFDFVIFVNHPNLVDMRPFIWKGWDVKVRYTYLFSLRSIEELYRGLDDAVRNKIRKAQRNGFIIKQANKANIFFDLWKLSFKRQRMALPLSREKFVVLFHKLAKEGLCKMYSAISPEGQIVAARIELFDASKAFDLVAGADPIYLNSGANQLLMWSILEDLAKCGFQSLDFVGADIPTIAKYKATFGGRLVPHYQVSKAISLRAKIIQSLKKTYHTFKPHKA